MKKILLSLSATILSTLAINAQVDYRFENWVTSGSAQDPGGWASFNVLTTLGMQQTVFKETTAPYGGTAAAKIVTQVIPALVPVPGYDTVGILIVGKVDLSTQKITYGTAYTNRPESVNFAVKCEPQPGDTASVSVQLTRYNTTTNKIDIVASGVWNSSTNIPTWTLKELKLNYNLDMMNVAPDTLRITASASSLYRPRLNSVLYIDEVTFSGYVSTNDINGVKNNVSVYPSPAKESVNISISVDAKAVKIMDVTGRTVGIFQMVNNKASIETANYKSGLYLYNVVDAENQVLGSGKFEVIK